MCTVLYNGDNMTSTTNYQVFDLYSKSSPFNLKGSFVTAYNSVQDNKLNGTQSWAISPLSINTCETYVCYYTCYMSRALKTTDINDLNIVAG